ncbi:MAG TPA: VanZ family protein [Chitinophagaceae bacterium]|nr:VanZ family protein [Chitinophagaceae bacterium]
MKKSVSTIIFAIIWLLLVTTLLCIPGTRLPQIKWDDKLLFDKWIHVLLFLILVLVWCRAYSKPRLKNIFIMITILSILYGIGMEIVQKYFIPFRSFDVGDIIADAVGCITGYLISIKKFYLN